uniref:Uncharacterized protein n=1 Tax=viral metagenome TaxID=1070528 RepID=A0A6M3IQJ7_9ZZZZ
MLNKKTVSPVYARYVGGIVHETASWWAIGNKDGLPYAGPCSSLRQLYSEMAYLNRSIRAGLYIDRP